MKFSHLIRLRHALIALGLLALAAAGLWILWVVLDLDVAKLKAAAQSLTQWMSQLPPVPFALTCIVLFLFPMPASAVFIAAGAAYGMQKGLAVASVAVLGNELLAYFLASRWMRKPILRLLARRGYNLPEVPPGKSADVVLLVRLAPAMPLFVQNYLLGIARVKLTPYILVSFPCSMAHITGFLMVGSSVYHENVTFAISGVFFLCFILLCVKLGRDWMLRKKARAAAPSA